MSDRLAVRKTYKLYVNGAFPRSESGRSYEVTDHRGHFLANAAWASRKDARDANRQAARACDSEWQRLSRLVEKEFRSCGFGRGLASVDADKLIGLFVPIKNVSPAADA